MKMNRRQLVWFLLLLGCATSSSAQEPNAPLGAPRPLPAPPPPAGNPIDGALALAETRARQTFEMAGCAVEILRHATEVFGKGGKPTRVQQLYDEVGRVGGETVQNMGCINEAADMKASILNQEVDPHPRWAAERSKGALDTFYQCQKRVTEGFFGLQAAELKLELALGIRVARVPDIACLKTHPEWSTRRMIDEEAFRSAEAPDHSR